MTGGNLIFFNCPHVISVNVHVHVFVAHNCGAMWNYDRPIQSSMDGKDVLNTLVLIEPNVRALAAR